MSRSLIWTKSSGVIITTDWLDSRNDAVEVIQAAMLDMEYHPE